MFFLTEAAPVGPEQGRARARRPVPTAAPAALAAALTMTVFVQLRSSATERLPQGTAIATRGGAGRGVSSCPPTDRYRLPDEQGELPFAFEGDTHRPLPLYGIPLPTGTDPAADSGRGS
ncbi:hypothetical protein [Streptomyces sp. NPDC056527]|uniref:hypothetical protein n=1 Tax=Streptomyces sp. NPDC056527 TaxID=3345853 RepID=UPI0036C5F256